MNDDTIGFKYIGEPPKQTYWEAARAIEPSLIRKAMNLAEALVQLTESGFKRVPEHVTEERKAICRTCHFWKPDGNWGLGECTRCGCTFWKTLYFSMRCPIGNWEAFNG